MPYWRKRRRYVSDDEDDSPLSESSVSDDEDDTSSPRRYVSKKKNCRTIQGPNATSTIGSYRQDEPRMNGTTFAGIYALKSQTTGITYVGKSNNIDTRIRQHRLLNGDDILIREPLVSHGHVNDLESWERNEVLTRMYRNGFESVRGWRFTGRDRLSLEEKRFARDDIIEKFDLCRRCGRNNHFTNNCFARTAAAWCHDIPMKD